MMFAGVDPFVAGQVEGVFFGLLLALGLFGAFYLIEKWRG